MKDSFFYQLADVSATMLHPVLRIVAGLFPQADPGSREEFTTNLPWFSSNDFRAFCQRHSNVEVHTLDEICNWLMGCQYEEDPDLSIKDTYWRNPREFEGSRRGDCKDFAFWAWRKVNELGIPAEFVGGVVRPRQKGDWLGHCWVQFHSKGVDYVLDGVIPERESMVLPLREVRRYYSPEFAVDRDFRRYGYLNFLRFDSNGDPDRKRRAMLRKKRKVRKPISPA